MYLRRVLLPTIVLSLSCPFSGAAAEFYVSTGGDDSQVGTAAEPFVTISRAQRAVRELKARGTLTVPVTVNIMPGTYPMASPLVFTPADSGTEACPVTYRRRGDGPVVLSGGRRLTGFARTDALWTLSIDAVKAGDWTFNQLYVNGRRRPRARTPNEGSYFRVNSALPEGKGGRRGFRYGKGHVREWENLEEVVFVVLASWYNTVHHVKELDAANRTVRFTNRAGRPFSWYEGHLRYYVENVAEGLDQPGEWFLDRASGVLSYFPLPGETLEDVEIVAPVVSQTLVRLQGEPGEGRYVEHVRFEGLQMRHTDAHLPKDLYDARQAATVQDAGLLADGARHCVFTDCEVANMGEHGIWFRDDCHHNLVERCHVHDLGGGGIYVGEKWRWGNNCPGWPGYKDLESIPHVTEHNTVDNCFVHNGCHLFTGSIGIWVGQAAHTTVSHNEICDMSYSGVSVGWDWSGNSSTSHHNTIERNHIHHIGHRKMNDMAGIYTLGVSPGTVLRNNHIHDVQAYQSPKGYCLGAGIYLDQSSAEITIQDNVCHDVSNAGFFIHHGANNRVLNNVFAEIEANGRIGWGMYFTSRLGKADRGNVAVGNIVHVPSGKAAKATQEKGKHGDGEAYDFVTIDRNVYWSSEKAMLTFSQSHGDEPEHMHGLNGWQRSGHDGESVTADPLFADPAKRDFSLGPGSPARKLGIRSIDTSAAGLYGDSAWVDLPKSTRYRAHDQVPSPMPDVALTLNETFEEQVVGYVPDHVQFVSPDKGAVVEVTDTAAADGTKCLRFTDAPGLKQAYHPNRVWRNLRVKDGPVRVSFDCMNSREKPAMFMVELRDWTGQPLKAGPSLMFQPDDRIRIGADRFEPCELGRWYHVEIAFELGEDAPGTYRLTVGPKGALAETIVVPFVSSEFKTLTWVGFVAMDADRHAEFFVDNLVTEME